MTGTQQETLDAVERKTFVGLLEVGRFLLKARLEAEAAWDQEPEVLGPGGRKLPYHSRKTATSRSMFGSVEVRRRWPPGWGRRTRPRGGVGGEDDPQPMGKEVFAELQKREEFGQELFERAKARKKGVKRKAFPGDEQKDIRRRRRTRRLQTRRLRRKPHRPAAPRRMDRSPGSWQSGQPGRGRTSRVPVP